MKIEHYLFNLLLDHDCVIISDFGGFVASYKSAHINAAQHTFYPPSKKIAFNASLRNNDGLLAHHISKNENILYAEACKIIAEYVNECFDILKNKNKLSLEKIGVLFYDNEKNIQFIPDADQNFLKDSFGLSFIHFPPVKRTETIFAPDAVKNLNATKKRKADWRIIELIPAAAIVALMFMFPVLTKNLNVDPSSLNPFNFKNKIEKVAPAKPLVAKQKIKPAIVIADSASVNSLKSDTIQAVNDTLAKAEITPIEPDKTINESVGSAIIETGTVNTSSADTETNFSSSDYFIIVGCFRIEENATRLTIELKSKGFNAMIVGKNNRGLTLVSASSFSDLNSAENALEKIQQNVEGNAWVYRKN